MKAATKLSLLEGVLNDAGADAIIACIDSYESIPSLDGVSAERIAARLRSDKKTLHGRTHFVLAERIGGTRITADVSDANVLAAIRAALAV
jgi:3-dehydroquinate synthase